MSSWADNSEIRHLPSRFYRLGKVSALAQSLTAEPEQEAVNRINVGFCSNTIWREHRDKKYL